MKRTFVVYKDRHSYIKLMTTEEKAEFLDAMFFYQNNDWDYVFKYGAVRVVFWKILEVFEADKKKWEIIRNTRSELWKLGGVAKASKRKQKLAKATNEETPSNSNIYILKNNLYIEEYISKYWKEMLDKFYNYWSEPDRNWKERREKQKTWAIPNRLSTWSNNNFGGNSKHSPSNAITQDKEYSIPDRFKNGQHQTDWQT